MLMTKQIVNTNLILASLFFIVSNNNNTAIMIAILAAKLKLLHGEILAN